MKALSKLAGQLCLDITGTSPAERPVLDQQTADYLEFSADEAKSKCFLHSAFVQMTLPHRKITENQYSKTNGINELHWLSINGIPYGAHARVLMYYLCTMAVKFSTREVWLQSSNKKLANECLGLTYSGPVKTSLQEQLERLATCIVTYKETRTLGDEHKWRRLENVPLFSEVTTVEARGRPRLDTMVFSETFYSALKDCAVPMNYEAIQALKNSCLAMDLYALLSYRGRTGSPYKVIPWTGMMIQMGADYAQVKNFKRDALVALAKVRPHLKGITLTETDSGLAVGRRNLELARNLS